MVSDVSGRCEICHKKAQTRVCMLCGKRVCASHFYPLLGICTDCVCVSDERTKGDKGET